ncbi:hypothetical protein D3C86_1315880 [compost metagenome]
MAQGLQVWDAGGGVALDTSDFTYNIIYNAVVTLASSAQFVTVVIPGYQAATDYLLVYHNAPQGLNENQSNWINNMLPVVLDQGGGSFRLTSYYSLPNIGGSVEAFGAFRLVCIRVFQ